MRKFLLAILSVLLFVCLGAAVACTGGNSDGTYYTLVFRQANGVRYVCDVPSGWEVLEGTTVSFKLVLDDDAEGEPVVVMTNLSDENSEEKVLTANDKGEYSFVIEGNTQIRVDGVIAKGEYNTLVFASTPGIMYTILNEGLENGMAVRSGTTVRFTLTRGDGYEGTPEVYANDRLLEADGNGVYSFEMAEPTTVRVEGVFKRINLNFKAAATHVKYLDVEINGNKLTDENDDTIDKIENTDYTAHIYAGDVVRFKVQISVYYVQNNYQVLAGNNIVRPNDDGVYEVTVQGNTDIQITKLELDVNFTERADGGSGTEYDPFRISRPVDLYMMAMLINDDFYTDGRYFMGYYRLENDIDLEGEQLYIIGDGSTGIAFFAGHFDGQGHTISNYYMTDSWIDQETYVDTALPYVGLFGYATPATVTSSPEISNLRLDNFTITVNASRYPSSSSGETYETYVGALVGLGFGVSITGCTATNGRINVTAHANWPSYVGGLIGQQMSAYSNTGSFAFYSPLVSCYTDVDINVYGQGFAYATGGITGLLVVGEEHTSAYILNSYSTGDINGGLNAGGIVGYASAGTAVINSYSSGDVTAYSPYAYNEGYGTDEFYRANAGGIVGRLGFNAVIYNSFSTGDIYASNQPSVTDKSLVKMDAVAAYCDNGSDLTDANMREPSVVGSRGVKASEVTEDFIRNTMKWHSADWVFENGMPAINYEETEKDFTVSFSATLGFGAAPAGIKMNTYRTMSNWNLQQNGIPEFVEGDGGMRSYAYFFDEALTQKVFYAFIPTDNMTLYIGYADYSEVAGTYFLGDDINSKARLTLNLDGTFEYRNGGLNLSSIYTWDGEQIVLRNTYLGDISKREQLSDAEYREYYLSSLYTFDATIDKETKTLYIQGGYVQEIEIVYLTTTNDYGEVVTVKDYQSTGEIFYLFNEAELKGTLLNEDFNYGEYSAGNDKYAFYGNGTGVRTGSDVLTFTYTWTNSTTLSIKYSNGTTETATVEDGYVAKIGTTTVKPFDGFTGTWESEFAMNSAYTFDGMGSWSYKSYSGSASGTYTVKDGVLNAGSFTAVINSDGFLEITEGSETTLYYVNGSFVGEWYYNQRYLDGKSIVSIVINVTLNGITQEGYGTGKAEFGTGEVYDLDYHATVNGDITTIYIYSNITMFGELTFDEASNLLTGQIDGRVARLAAYDNYQGVWVSDNDALSTVQFNGLGYYDLAGSTANDYLPIQSKVWVGNKASGKYTLDRATMTATYTYNNVVYTLKYNKSTGYIDVTAANVEPFTLQPRDIWYNNDLIDDDGFVYTFDGRGNLTKGGIVYADNGRDTDMRQYTYFLSEDGMVIKLVSTDPVNYPSGTISVKTVGGKQVFQFARDNTTAISLTRYTAFTGEWIIGGERGNITIGKIYADNTAEGTYSYYTFDGKKSQKTTTEISLTYNLEGRFMSFEFTEKDGTVSTVYVNAYISKSATELSIGYYNDITSAYNSICVSTDAVDSFYNKEFKVYDAKKNADTGETLILDGLGYSVFGYGTATLYNDEGTATAGYSYTVDKYGHALVASGYRQYCMVPWTKGENLEYAVLYYVHEGNEYFAIVLPDSLYDVTVKDKETAGVTYEFNGVGSVTRFVNGVEDVTYEYLIVLTDSLEYQHVIAFTDENGKVYSVTLDQKSSDKSEWTVLMVEADSLFTVTAQDASDENAIFLFCGNGRVIRLSTEEQAENYTYEIISGTATDKIITLEFTTSTGKVYTATLDRSSDNEEEWTVSLTLKGGEAA